MFLALMLLPALALGWMGWRLVEQDRMSEARRAQERRERATDLIVTALRQSIAADEQRLADSSLWPSLASDDARVVVLTSHAIETLPKTRLLYYPFASALPEAPAELFQSGEVDEFRFQNHGDAIIKFEGLARSSDPAIRAGAQLRLARNLRGAGQLVAALDLYTELAKQDAVALAGNPAGLVAQRARCALLADLNRPADLKHEAELMNADLRRGRWQLDRAQYTHYSSEAAQWLDNGLEAEAADDALAAAVDHLWRKWKAFPPEATTLSGQEGFRDLDPLAVLMWRGTAERMAAFVAGPVYIERNWLASLRPLLESQGVRLTLQESNEGGVSADVTQRAASDTGLPWTVRVTNAHPQSEFAQSAVRRRLLLTGLALLVIVVCAGSYFVARTVARELALARLQSDFVAAVSHEFRTPLTSLSQVTEILTDGRVADAGQLQRYYQTQARATGRLERLVESLLDFGRMEAGTKPYRMQQLDASEVVRCAVEECRTEAAAAGYQIELDVHNNGSGGFDVKADPDALLHALRNLLDNAIKYSPDCRTISVDIAKVGSRVAIRIRDRGFGIPRAEQKEIFRKFVRGEAAKTNGIKGTGVGLAMVQHIVRAHGGEIRLESAPGKGSTFTMLFPESRS